MIGVHTRIEQYADFPRIRQTGFDSVRLPIYKQAWEKFPHEIIRAAAAADEAELHVLPCFLADFSETWRPRGPHQREAFVAFASEVLDETRWTIAEIWNEGNLQKYKIGKKMNPEHLSLLLEAAEERLDVPLISGGAAPSHGPWAGPRYLRELLRHFEKFHGVGYHPYGASAADSAQMVEEIRRLTKKPLYLTELGWGDRGIPSPHLRADQGDAIVDLLKLVKGRVAGAWIFNWRDERSEEDVPWTERAGLTYLDSSPKPALEIVRSYLR